MKLFTVTLCLMLKCVFVYSANVPRSDLFPLNIVHYNDFHARFEESSKISAVCRTNDSQCYGGFARLYYEIKTLMKDKPNVLLLNAGDTFQGTYWYTRLKWNVTQEFINMLPNDAHAIGNHEFDDGIAGLTPYLKSLKAPVVAANLNLTLTPELQPYIKPSTIIERGGRRIGIIGLITPLTKTSSRTGLVGFTDPKNATRAEAQKLKREGIDIIIVLSHCGLDVDKEIAGEVGEDIDLIIGGHSHSLLWNGDVAPNNGTISGPYPVLVENPDTQHKVLIVTASAFTRYVGNLTAYFDEEGELQAYHGEPVYLSRSIPEDPEVKALLQPYKERLHAYFDIKVGETEVDLFNANCSAEECPLGNLVTDSLLDAAKEMHVSNLTYVALITGGNLRSPIAKGEITRGLIVNTVPFTNKVLTFPLQGRQIVTLLERCMTKYWTKKPFRSNLVPQVAGMRVVLNSTDAKALSVEVEKDGVYTALDSDEYYQFITYDILFILLEEDFLTQMNKSANLTYVGLDSDILTRHIEKITPIKPSLENRVTLVS